MQRKTSKILPIERYLPWCLGLAFLWGLSEATIFFIVPDVIITFIALTCGVRQGVIAVCAAVSGAIVGGVMIYFWGKQDIASARAFFDLLPAIGPSTIERARSDISGPHFGASMFYGSLTGVPFKLYASEAGSAGTSLIGFIMLTPLVRLPRFMVAAIGAAMFNKFGPALFKAHKLKIMSMFWVAFYALYWSSAAS